MQKIVVLFGGCSPEYGVSLESAAAVLEGLDPKRFQAVPVGITTQGDWYLYSGDRARIPDGTWLASPDLAPAALSPSRSEHTLLIFRGGEPERLNVDAVFPVLHGQNGEDGSVQGLCAVAGMPLVGCGVLASALGMDKDRAHRLVHACGVPVPKSAVFGRGFGETEVRRQARKLGFPLFVKPVGAGSSFGITRVTEEGGLSSAIAEAFHYDSRILLERQIPGFEVGCAVMGNETLVTGELDEIELAEGFFDFTEKYQLITSRIHVPARVSAEAASALKHTAKTVYRALGCRGFARVDLFLTPDNRVVFHEINTIPGFTAHSRFPSMMAAAGLPFREVLTHLIELAVEP